MKKLQIIIAVSALGLSACATGYKVDSFKGGQAPKWRSTDVLEIISRGNGYTSSKKLGQMTLLRAAETAIQAQYRYFIEIDSVDKGSTHTVTTPQTSTTYFNSYNTGYGATGAATTYSFNNSFETYKPGSNVLYKMFVELPADARPGQFYDAYEVYNELGPKYIDHFEPKHPLW